MDLDFTTKWSANIKNISSGNIGRVITKDNSIKFHLDGSVEIFNRNFFGNNDMHHYKIFTYGASSSDSKGYFYHVSKMFQFNGDCTNFNGDSIDGIQSFSFEIQGISEWLNVNSVDFGFSKEGTLFIHEIPTPTIILKESNPKIYIKYEVKDFLDTRQSQVNKFINKEPRIYVEFKQPENDKKVEFEIMTIMRFFSILIGKIGYAKDIRLELNDYEMKMWLFLNKDFSVNISGNSYWMKTRFEIKEIHEFLSDWYERWYDFSSDNTYKMLLDAYYELCIQKAHSIEDVFLTYCRFIEGYSLRKSDDEKISNDLEKNILPCLNDANFKEQISRHFENANSNYKAKTVANWISRGFLSRISLSTRISRIDEANFEFIKANSDKCSIEDIYSKISKTRNYYAHYKADTTDVLDLSDIYKILPFLEMLILSILMTETGIDYELRKKIFIHDEVFWMYATHLRDENL